MNSAFRARLLASSVVISQVLFTSEQPKKTKWLPASNKVTLKQVQLLFGPLVTSSLRGSVNIHLYSPPLRWIIVKYSVFVKCVFYFVSTILFVFRISIFMSNRLNILKLSGYLVIFSFIIFFFILLVMIYLFSEFQYLYQIVLKTFRIFGNIHYLLLILFYFVSIYLFIFRISAIISDRFNILKSSGYLVQWFIDCIHFFSWQAIPETKHAQLLVAMCILWSVNFIISE